MTRVPRSRAMVAVYLVLAAVTSWSCAPARFREQAIVWHVDDTRDIPEPDESHYVRALHFGNVFVFNPIERALSLPDEEEAHDLNALDELPSSTWFENRIGMFELTAADVARGPGGKPPVLPFVLTKGKGEGRQPGFIAEDQTGRTFLVKFDPLGLAPEDPAEFRIMQEKELSHGRLAMLAAAGFMAQEAVTDQTWGSQDTALDNLVFGAWFAAEKADYGM